MITCHGESMLVTVEDTPSDACSGAICLLVGAGKGLRARQGAGLRPLGTCAGGLLTAEAREAAACRILWSSEGCYLLLLAWEFETLVSSYRAQHSPRDKYLCNSDHHSLRLPLSCVPKTLSFNSMYAMLTKIPPDATVRSP